jgi:hypothetical protein
VEEDKSFKKEKKKEKGDRRVIFFLFRHSVKKMVRTGVQDGES